PIVDEKNHRRLRRASQWAGRPRLAVGDGLVEQLLRPGGLVEIVPHGVVLQAPYTGDAGFSPAAALHHALQRFEEVETVDLDAAIADRHGMAHVSADGSIDLRLAIRHRYRRACQHREFQLARDLYHALGLGPAIGQMLVVEDWNRPARLAEHVCDFSEELESRIELLALF